MIRHTIPLNFVKCNSLIVRKYWRFLPDLNGTWNIGRAFKNNIFSGSIRTPASRAVIQRTIQRVEKISEIIYFVAINFGVPGVILPKALKSFFTYFTTDSGSDAFELPYVMW